jgi:hypothetical protein
MPALPIGMGILAGGIAALPVEMRALHLHTWALPPEIRILDGEIGILYKGKRSMQPSGRLWRLKRELWVVRCGPYIRKREDCFFSADSYHWNASAECEYVEVDEGEARFDWGNVASGAATQDPGAARAQSSSPESRLALSHLLR